MLDPRDTIEPLYRAFEDNPAPTYLDRSPYDSKEDQLTYDQLVTIPLRQIPPAILGPYASSALFTVGDENDYRHYLPRILEIGLFEHGWTGFEPWAIANRLEYGKWRTWPAKEREALRFYFAAGFDHASTLPMDAFAEFEDWLVAVLTLGEDANGQLKLAVANGGGNAVLALARIITEHQKNLCRKRDFASGIWDNVDPAKRADTVEFLVSQHMQELLIQHGCRASAEDQFCYFEPALNVLDQL